MKKVILEGCNGEWAQKRYLPFLVKEAAKGNIKLWAVDINPGIELDDLVVAVLWRKAQRKGNACYLDNRIDRETYERLSNADYVFIVTPDQYHSQLATFWLERLAPEGKIFIEKPLDACVKSALKLKKKIEEEKRETVFAFDHYLARAYPLLGQLKEIGRIEKIELHLLESSPIGQKRIETLAKGMIFDLFCHVLALVCAVVSKDLTCSVTNFPTVKLDRDRVKGARYAGCPISGETFAWTEFLVNGDIEVGSVIGKCVGVSDKKFMKIYGSEGRIEVYFSTKEDCFSIIDSQGERKVTWKFKTRPVESLLEKLLSGEKHPLSLPGVLSFDAALEILKILDKAKRRIGDKMREYQCNDSIDNILGILGEKKGVTSDFS